MADDNTDWKTRAEAAEAQLTAMRYERDVALRQLEHIKTSHADIVAKRDAALAQVEELKRYATHREYCAYLGGGDCNCGFAVILSTPTPAPRPKCQTCLAAMDVLGECMAARLHASDIRQREEKP